MITLTSSNRKKAITKDKNTFQISDIIFNLNFKKKNKSNYHWDNNIKLKKDLREIYKIYNKLLNLLTIRLNIIHHVNFSKKYWEILIWRWLIRYIIYYFDRWEIITSLLRLFKKKDISVNFVKFNKLKFVPFDTHDYSTRCVMSDDWNHWVYNDILEKRSKFKFKCVNKKKINPLPNLKIKKKNSFKNNLKFFTNPFLNKKIITQNLGFSKENHLGLKIYLKKMHYVNDNIFSRFKSNFDHDKRSKLSEFSASFKTNFLRYMISNLKYNFPKIFLENYKFADKELKKYKLPTHPKLIISSVDDAFNEPFKFFAARKVLDGCKLFHLQHGGSYGTSDDYPVEKIQIKLNDKFLSWGWSDKSKKIEKLFCQKTIGMRIKQTKKTAGLIMPIFDWHLYPGDIGSGRPRTLNDINLFINNLNVFFSTLRDDIKTKSAFKFLKYENNLYPKYVFHSLKSKFRKANFFHSKKSSIYYLEKYKIYVDTLNSTGYLETLNLNLPTILIFDERICRIRQNAKKYFLSLEKAKILFKDAKAAAKFINENYEKVDEWWSSKKVQLAVKNFTNKFARSTNNPYIFLEKLKKYT
jgi:putative transferase (TIGR04331 family)